MDSAKSASRETETCLRLLMVGKTGSGKSSTANTILGHGRSKFRVVHGLGSAPLECQLERSLVNGRIVEIVECPGLFNVFGSHEEIAKAIVQAMLGLHPGPTAILYTVEIGSRYTEEEYITFNRLKLHLGQEVTKYMIVVFTRGDYLLEEGMTIHEYLRMPPPTFRKVLTECGHRYAVFNNRASDKMPQVTNLLDEVEALMQKNSRPYFQNPVYQEMGLGLEMETIRRIQEDKRLTPEEQASKQDEIQSGLIESEGKGGQADVQEEGQSDQKGTGRSPQKGPEEEGSQTAMLRTEESNQRGTKRKWVQTAVQQEEEISQKGPGGEGSQAVLLQKEKSHKVGKRRWDHAAIKGEEGEERREGESDEKMIRAQGIKGPYHQTEVGHSTQEEAGGSQKQASVQQERQIGQNVSEKSSQKGPLGVTDDTVLRQEDSSHLGSEGESGQAATEHEKESSQKGQDRQNTQKGPEGEEGPAAILQTEESSQRAAERNRGQEDSSHTGLAGDSGQEEKGERVQQGPQQDIDQTIQQIPEKCPQEEGPTKGSQNGPKRQLRMMTTEDETSCTELQDPKITDLEKKMVSSDSRISSTERAKKRAELEALRDKRRVERAEKIARRKARNKECARLSNMKSQTRKMDLERKRSELLEEHLQLLSDVEMLEKTKHMLKLATRKMKFQKAERQGKEAKSEQETDERLLKSEEERRQWEEIKWQVKQEVAKDSQGFFQRVGASFHSPIKAFRKALDSIKTIWQNYRTVLSQTITQSPSSPHTDLDLESTADIDTDSDEQPVFSKRWQFEREFSSTGGQLQAEYSDVKLTVPEDSVRAGESVVIRGAVSTNLELVHKTFKLSSEERIVSPVVEYFAGPHYTFEKPVRISLPHFISGEPLYRNVTVYWFHKVGTTFHIQKIRPREAAEGSSSSNFCEDDKQNGTFHFQGPDYIEVFVTSFCGFVCAHCGQTSPQLLFRLYGSTCGDNRKDVKVSLFVWDKRLNNKDFRENIIPSSEEAEKFILARSMNAPTDPTELKLAILFTIEPRYQDLWMHKLDPNGRPWFPPEQEIDFARFNPACYDMSAMCLEWLLGCRPGQNPGKNFQAFIRLDYFSSRTCDSGRTAQMLDGIDTMTLHIELMLTSKDRMALVASTRNEEKMEQEDDDETVNSISHISDLSSGSVVPNSLPCGIGVDSLPTRNSHADVRPKVRGPNNGMDFHSTGAKRLRRLNSEPGGVTKQNFTRRSDPLSPAACSGQLNGGCPALSGCEHASHHHGHFSHSQNGLQGLPGKAACGKCSRPGNADAFLGHEHFISSHEHCSHAGLEHLSRSQNETQNPSASLPPARPTQVVYNNYNLTVDSLGGKMVHFGPSSAVPSQGPSNRDVFSTAHNGQRSLKGDLSPAASNGQGSLHRELPSAEANGQDSLNGAGSTAYNGQESQNRELPSAAYNGQGSFYKVAPPASNGQALPYRGLPSAVVNRQGSPDRAVASPASNERDLGDAEERMDLVPSDSVAFCANTSVSREALGELFSFSLSQAVQCTDSVANNAYQHG